MKLIVKIYCKAVAAKAAARRIARQVFPRVVPQRLQPFFVDSSGDLTTTIAWLLGIVVIAGVGTVLWTQVIQPNMTHATTNTNNLVNSLP